MPSALQFDLIWPECGMAMERIMHDPDATALAWSGWDGWIQNCRQCRQLAIHAWIQPLAPLSGLLSKWSRPLHVSKSFTPCH